MVGFFLSRITTGSCRRDTTLREPFDPRPGGVYLGCVVYYISKEVSFPFDTAIERVKEELKKEGFGVLTEIDVQDTLKKKLDVDFRKYRILGACNPPFAHKALQAEERIGLLLPCNLIVQERSDGKVDVAAIDPAASMQAVGNPALESIAGQVRDKLKAVIARL
jgi:uncharacterized protein (DUF302 family)